MLRLSGISLIEDVSKRSIVWADFTLLIGAAHTEKEIIRPYVPLLVDAFAGSEQICQ